MDTKIFFQKKEIDNHHYRQLRKRIKEVVAVLPKSRLKTKAFVVLAFPILYFSVYAVALYNFENYIVFCGLYGFLGVLAVIIFINIIHDAVHGNIFKNKNLNLLALFLFDIMGGNSYVWKKRHMLMHHNYQNISGWDSDIEQSGLIKIYPDEKSNFINKYQHKLIFVFYPLFLFNWIFLRDFKDFFMKNRLIKKVCKIPTIQYFKLFFFKAVFLTYTVFIPLVIGVPVKVVLIALFVLLVSGGVFALLVLLTPHVNDRNEFLTPNKSGQLNVSWFRHQFLTTNDISADNWITRNIMGNFNFHLAHHLFPKISSVYAPEITKVIKEYALENGFEYRSYKLKNALSYHYRLIKSNALSFDFFEEDM